MSPRLSGVLSHLALAVALGFAGLYAAAHLDVALRLERGAQDALLRAHAGVSPDPDIVVLDIDESSLEAMSAEVGRFPWPRAVYGSLLEGLARQRPAAVVFDILFVDPDRADPLGDRYFIDTARKLTNVYFPIVLLTSSEKGQGLPLENLPVALPAAGNAGAARAAFLLPPRALWETGRIGAINVDGDEDGVIRRYPLYIETQGWRIPSLASRVASGLNYQLPDASALPLAWHAHAYRHIPFYDVYADLERRVPQRPRDEFRGKIVLIGASAAGLHDLKVTPLATDYPGVDVIATALDNLKHGEALHFAPPAVAAAGTLALLLALGAGFGAGFGPVRIGAALVAGSGAILALVWTAAARRWMFPVATPLGLAWLYYVVAAVRAYWTERRQRERVTRLFGRFLDPRVVRTLVDHGEAVASQAGQRREVTVLFSDIRGFTTLSERQSPQAVLALLNRYFEMQVEVIFRHQGTLDKYIGDAIMAFWGAPTEQPDHACRALACAREMEATLAQFQAEIAGSGINFDIGIGIHTGEVVAGFIGSARRRQDYTIIGDVVNTASRIEGATRDRARVLVSAATRDACPELTFVDHGQFKLKGKQEEVHLYEPQW